MKTLPTMAVTMPMSEDHSSRTSPGSFGPWELVGVARADVARLRRVAVDREGIAAAKSIDTRRAFDLASKRSHGRSRSRRMC